MGLNFAEYLAAADAAQKSGMSGKDFVKQQRQAQVNQQASQTFNYGIRNTFKYEPPAPPPKQKSDPNMQAQKLVQEKDLGNALQLMINQYQTDEKKKTDDVKNPLSISKLYTKYTGKI